MRPRVRLDGREPQGRAGLDRGGRAVVMVVVRPDPGRAVPPAPGPRGGVDGAPVVPGRGLRLPGEQVPPMRPIFLRDTHSRNFRALKIGKQLNHGWGRQAPEQAARAAG